MANSGWLSALIGIPQLLDDGDEVQPRSVWNLIGANAVDNIAESRTDITFPVADGGAGFAVADLTELRAVTAAARTDRQARYVVSKKRFYAFLEAPGAGVADDGEDVILPDDLVLGSAGRWYSAPQIATESLAGLLTATEKVRIRYGYGGALRAYYAVDSNVANLASFTASQDGVDGTAGKRVFLFGQNSASENGIYVLGTVGGGGTCALTRATDMAVGAELLYGTKVVVDQGALWAGYEFELTSTGPCTVGTNDLVFAEARARSDHTKVETLYEIGGTPVSPGTQKAAEIQAVLDGGGIAVLQPGGVYELEAPILVDDTHSGLGIVCPTGVATLVEAFPVAPDVSQADVSSNALVLIRGTLNAAKLNTTLTTDITPGGAAYYGANTRKVSVASLGTIEPGDYFIIGGHESAVGETPGGSNGSAVDSAEIVRCASTAAAPNRITLDYPTAQHHVTNNGGVGTALYVKAVDPVVGFRLEGLEFSATGSTIAVGVLVERAVGLEVERVLFEGFSRAAIDIESGRDITITDVEIGEECACGLFISAAVNANVHGYRTTAETTRSHANGLRRASIFCQFNPINVRIDGFLIRHVVQGVSVRGGRHVDITNGIIDDCDIRTQTVDGYHIALRGVAICTGGGEGAYDEYVGPVNVHNVTVSNCRSDATASVIDDQQEFSALVHDVHQCEWSGVSIVNNGLSPSTTIDGDDDYMMFGMGFQDASGTFTDVECRGVEFGFGIRSGAGITLTNCRHLAAPGAGASTSVSLIFLSDGIGTTINGFEGAAYVWFGSNYTSNVYLPELRGSYRFVEQTVDGPLYIAKNTTGGAVTHGDIVAADPASTAGTRLVITPTITSTALYQVVGRYGLSGYPNNGYCLVKKLPEPNGQVTTVGATNLGDAINWTPGALTCTPSAAPTVYTIGTALDAKGAGTALMRIGPPSRRGVTTATATTDAARGASGELVAAWFAPAGTIATAGLVRSVKGAVHVAARNKDNDGNIALVATESANNSANFGMDETGTYSAQYAKLGGAGFVVVDGGSQVYLEVGGSIKVTLDASNFDSALPVKTDTINEHTAATGVTIDGFKIKDNGPDLDKWRQHVISIDVDDGAAGTPIPELIAGIPAYACTVVRAVFVARDNVTGDNTNTATLKVWRRNGSGTQAAVASLALTTGINLTAFVAKDIGAITNAALAADECVTVEVTKGAAGLRIRGTFTITVTTDR